MITVLTGENDFLTRQKLAELIKPVASDVEHYDGDTLTTNDLADIVGGMTLFADSRTIIIRSLSENSVLWGDAPRFLERLTDSTTLILIEPALDKRTKTYKWLHINAEIVDAKPWSTRDEPQANMWFAEQVSQLGVTLTDLQRSLVIRKTGLHAGNMYAALEKLSLATEVTDDLIEQVIETASDDSVFELFEAALSGKKTRINELLENLKLEADAYQIVGVLAGQSLQLVALALGDRSSAEVAAVTGFHPFGLSKLSRYAKTLGPKKARQIVKDVADTDARIKTTAGDPWASVEALLYKIIALSS